MLIQLQMNTLNHLSTGLTTQVLVKQDDITSVGWLNSAVLSLRDVKGWIKTSARFLSIKWQNRALNQLFMPLHPA